MVMALVVGGCAAPAPAPVEDRSEPREREITRSRSGLHVVTGGDTLYSIAFRYGVDWRELAEWNDIGSPYTIFPGQTLRLSDTGPARREREVAAAPEQPPVRQDAPSPATVPESAETGPEPEADPEADPDPEPETRPEPVPEIIDAPRRSVAGIQWRWPTEGGLARRFDPGSERKGIEISGEEGQPVIAAADGQVVYSGTGLLGYGELIIIKHSDALLSAYGHNRQRLVGEGEQVTGGQRIAELGRNERDEKILHFEIRRNGDPEDPLRYLPPL